MTQIISTIVKRKYQGNPLKKKIKKKIQSKIIAKKKLQNLQIFMNSVIQAIIIRRKGNPLFKKKKLKIKKKIQSKIIVKKKLQNLQSFFNKEILT